MLTHHDIKVKLKQLRRTQGELGEAIGMPYHTINRTVNGERVLRATEMIKIEAQLELWETAFTPHAGGRTKEVDRIPFYTTPSADNTAVNLGKSAVIELVKAHPSQDTDQRPFAVRIANDLMSPRFEPGETAYIARIMPRRYDDCLIERTDGTAVVCRYTMQKDGMVFCEQLNPETELRFPAKDVIAVHKVVGRG